MAAPQKPGRFELADSGPIFLDEIGDLPLGLQAKLLGLPQSIARPIPFLVVALGVRTSQTTVVRPSYAPFRTSKDAI